MTRLNWGETGQRRFETGADRGVLYVPGFVGVPWNGLVSVQENSTGGEAQPYYLDGIKYLNVASKEEFEATIEAFSAPSEFGVCDGSVEIHNGLFITNQKRKPFGLSYRTLIGNDLKSTEYGYKLHFVYNALAAPSEKAFASLNDSPEPMVLSWGISTTPNLIPGYRPSAHLVIDSTKVTGYVLKLVEDVLYGTESEVPRLPTPEELIALMYMTPPVVVDGFTSTFMETF